MTKIRDPQILKFTRINGTPTMEPISLAIVGAWLVDKVLGNYVDQGLEHFTNRYFSDHTKKKAFQDCLSEGLEEFLTKYPDLANSFFDKTFIEGPAAAEINKWMTLTEQPSAERLEEAYRRQFRSAPISIASACREFVEIMRSKLNANEQLADFFSNRLIREIGSQLIELKSGSGWIAANSSSPRINLSTVSRVLTDGSWDLLHWQSALPDGTRIDRPECQTLKKALAEGQSATFALLGLPGVGKTSLLSELANFAANAGVTTFAIKADMLDSAIATAEDLQRFFGFPDRIDRVIESLSREAPFLLIVDQFDALCGFVDVKTRRIEVLLRLISNVKNIENVLIVYSCRDFEHACDSRFAALKAKPIELQPPSWPLIEPIVTKHGIDTTRLSEELKELLRIPQHLSVFLKVSSGGNVQLANSYLGVLEAYWRKCLDGPHADDRRELLEKIVDSTVELEDHWVPRARFADRAIDMDRLVADGFLVYAANGTKVGFSHQTFGDFAKSRAFVENRNSISEYAVKNAQRLFVRPILWSVLHYLRGVSRRDYERELSQIWKNPDNPFHLRRLLTEFLGSQDTPSPFEIGFLGPSFATGDARTALIAVGQSRGWFAHLAKARLPAWMGSRPDELLVRIALSNGIRHSPALAIELMREHWTGRHEWSATVAVVLTQLKDWNDTSLELAIGHANANELESFWIEDAFEKAHASIGGKSYALLRSILDAQLEAIIAASNGTSAPSAYPSSSHPLVASLEKAGLWHQLLKIVAGAPAAFLEHLLDWYERALASVIWPPSRYATIYRSDGITHWLVDDDGDDFPRRVSAFNATFILAATNASIQSPDAFVRLVERSQSSQMMGLHRVLSAGLAHLPDTHADAGVRYLLADPRRFYVGTEGKPISGTCDLIASLGQKTSKDQFDNLVAAIKAWKGPFKTDKSLTAQDRAENLKTNDLARLQLLGVLPRERLDASTNRKIEEERRRFAIVDVELPASRIRGGYVGSPMSVDQLKAASVKDIVRLLNEVPDGVDRHKNQFLIGGNYQLCQALEALAKTEPTKAIVILEALEPTNQQNAAEAIFRSLANFERAGTSALLSSSEFLDLFRNSVTRGFGRRGNRDGFCFALSSLAQSAKGLPDDICRQLTEWLAEEPPHAQVSNTDASEKDGWAGKDPVVFVSQPGLSFVPHGSYPIIGALLDGYVFRQPMDDKHAYDALLNLRHRNESDSVWQQILYRYRFLLNRFPVPGRRFILDLLSERAILRSAHVFLVALFEVHKSLGESDFLEAIDGLRGDERPHCRQGFGELVFARSLTHPNDARIAALLAEILKQPFGSPEHIGILHCAASASCDAGFRGRTTDVLLRAIRSDDDLSQVIAIGTLRQGKSLKIDDHTVALFESTIQKADKLSLDAISICLDRLSDLSVEHMELSVRFLEAAVKRVGPEIADTRTKFALHAEDLVQIAIGAHRTIGFEKRGLALFEQLLDLGVYFAPTVLEKIDRRPFR